MQKFLQAIKNNLYVKSFGSGAQAFAFFVTNGVNLLLSAFVYFLGMGMTKLFALVFKKHFLGLNVIDTKKKSYWIGSQDNKYKTEDFYKMF